MDDDITVGHSMDTLLCSDGKTVRPIPGMVDRFAEFCKKFREENPEQAKDMIFEAFRVDKEDNESN